MIMFPKESCIRPFLQLIKVLVVAGKGGLFLNYRHVVGSLSGLLYV